MTLSQKSLIRRYLIWCYKTTKEELDRIDRYFTQSLVDQRLLALLSKTTGNDTAYQKKIDDFKIYMAAKEKSALEKKYLNFGKKVLQPQYRYLQDRLAAIEQVIVEFFGKSGLKTVQALYETEMTRRILEAREHA